MDAIETNAQEFAETFRKYASFAHSVTGQALIKREAQKLASILYAETLKVAHTIAQVTADVVAQGWKIPTTFSDGRIGRGTPDQWTATAIATLPTKRGRKSKSRLQAEALIKAAKPTLADMQAFVIKHRAAHIGYVASGWGRHNVEISESEHEVEITNHNPGMAAVDAKHHVVDKAMAIRAVDMQDWIERQLHEMKEAA